MTIAINPHAALASDYERARLCPRGDPWADSVVDRMGRVIRLVGHVESEQWTYSWDDIDWSIRRFPRARREKIRLDRGKREVVSVPRVYRVVMTTEKTGAA